MKGSSTYKHLLYEPFLRLAIYPMSHITSGSHPSGERALNFLHFVVTPIHKANSIGYSSAPFITQHKYALLNFNIFATSVSCLFILVVKINAYKLIVKLKNNQNKYRFKAIQPALKTLSSLF